MKQYTPYVLCAIVAASLVAATAYAIAQRGTHEKDSKDTGEKKS